MVWELSLSFYLAVGFVLALGLGQRAAVGIFELALKAHGVNDDNPLERRHPETTLVVSTWALVVLPKIYQRYTSSRVPFTKVSSASS